MVRMEMIWALHFGAVCLLDKTINNKDETMKILKNTRKYMPIGEDFE